MVKYGENTCIVNLKMIILLHEMIHSKARIQKGGIISEQMRSKYKNRFRYSLALGTYPYAFYFSDAYKVSNG